MTTIADVYGPEVAVLCHGELPVRGNAYAGKVPWSVLNEGRAIMERGGINWRPLHQEQRRLSREAAERYEQQRRTRLIAENAEHDNGEVDEDG
jgi:hypothetical protein